MTERKKNYICANWLFLAVSLGVSWLVGCGPARNSNDRHDGARVGNVTTQPHTRSVNDIVEVQRFPVKGKSDVTDITGLAFSPDGRYLASAAWGDLTLWDWKNGKKHKVLKSKDVKHNCVAFSPDGKEVVTGAQDGVLRFWNVDSGAMIRSLGKHAGWIVDVSFSRDGKRLIAAATNTKEILRLWDLETGKVIHSAMDANSHVFGASFLAGDSMAIGVGWTDETLEAEGAKFWVFDLVKGSERTINIPKEGIFLAVAPVSGQPSRFIVACARIGGLEVRDVNTGAVIQHIPGLLKTAVHAIAVSSEGRYVLTGGGGEKEPPLDTPDCLVLWDLVKGKMIKKFSADDVMGLNVAISPDGHFAASGGSKDIVIWELKN